MSKSSDAETRCLLKQHPGERKKIMQKISIGWRLLRFASASAVLFAPLTCVSEVGAQEPPKYTQPLATGDRLDPIGDAVDLGNMPEGMALAPGGDKLAVVLSGWREQGVQIVELKTHRVLQTLPQPAAFLGGAFSRDGKRLFVSGGNEDAIFCYLWKGDTATLERKIVLAEKAPG